MMNTKPYDDLEPVYSEVSLLRSQKAMDDEANYWLNEPTEAPIQTQPQQPKKSGANWFQEAAGALYGGAIKDSYDNVSNFVRHIESWVMRDITKKILPASWESQSDKEYEAMLNLSDEEFTKMYSPFPDIQNKTTIGKMGREFASFATLFIPVEGEVKAMELSTQLADSAKLFAKSAPKVSQFFSRLAENPRFTSAVDSTLASAVVTATRDPYEERLSNLIEGTPLANPVTKFLAADPNDSYAVAELKNVMEDMGLGVITEGFIGLARAVKARRIIKSTIPDGDQILQQADDILKKVQQGANPDEVMAEISRVTPNEAADQLQSLRKSSIVPEDTALRTPEEITDIRNYALDRGEEGVSQYLNSFPDAPMTVNDLIDHGTPEQVVDYLAQLRQVSEDNGVNGIGVIAGHNIKEVNSVPISEQVNQSIITNVIGRLSNESGEVSPQLLLNPAVIGGIGGGLSGGLIDYNGDGKIDYQDIGIGLLLGAGLSYAGTKVVKSIKGDQLFKQHQSEQLTKVDGMIKSLEDAKMNPQLNQQSLAMIDNSIADLQKVRQSMTKVTNPDQLIESVKSPLLSERVKKNLEPVVKLDQTHLTNFTEKLQINDLGKALSIDFDRVNTPEMAQSLVDNVLASFPKEIQVASRKMFPSGVTTGTWEDAREYAAAAGISVKQVNNAFLNLNNTDGKVLAARTTLTAAQNRLIELMTQIANKAPGDITDNEIIQLRKQASLYGSLQAQVFGMKAELGRALNSLKILGQTSDMLDADALSTAIEALGGKNKNIEVAKQFLAQPTPAKKMLFAQSLYKNPGLNLVSSWFYNSLLSNPATLISNATSGIFTTGLSTITRGVARFMPGLGGAGEGVLPGEAKYMAMAIIDAQNDALRLAAKSWKTGDPIFDVINKVDSAFRASDLIADPKSFLSGTIDRYLPEAKDQIANVLDVMGTVGSYPTRTLMATDEYWKVINHQMDFYSQCYRDAYKTAIEEGLEGDVLDARVLELAAELRAHPDPEMWQKAMQFARENTFNSKLDPHKNWIQAVGFGLSQMTTAAPALKFLIPFVRTITNIPSYVAEYTPVLNLTLKNTWESLLHGTKEQKQMTMAKMSIGAAIMTTAIWLAEKGIITGGGPKDSSAAKLNRWQPYSIHIGDKYFSYNRLDPIAGILGIAADIHDIFVDSDDSDTTTKLIFSSLAAMGKNLLSKTYLQQIAKLLDAAQDPTPINLSRILGTTIGGFAPGILSSVERGINPAYSEMYGLLDNFKSRVPGLSDTLPPKRDLFGEPTAAAGWSWAPMFNPMTYSKESGDPVKQELASLKFISANSVLKSMYQIDGVELTPQQHDRYVVFMGQPLKQYLDQLVASPTYQAASEGDDTFPGSKQYLIKQAISMFKYQARAALLNENPDLANKIQARHAQRWDAMTNNQ